MRILTFATLRHVATLALALGGVSLGFALVQGGAPSLAPPACSERAFLADGSGYSWGSFTRWRGGWLTAYHVIDSGAVIDGPAVESVADLPATDFAFLTGAPLDADPESVAPLAGPVTLEGFPARASAREHVSGEVYAPDTVPPGIWVLLDHAEPLVGGFSGGCVRDAAGEVVAVIMGASSMRLDGAPRHFARVIPIRDALREVQGHRWEGAARPLSFLNRPVPARMAWPGTDGEGTR